MVTAAGSAPAGVFVFVKAMLTVLVEAMVPVIMVFVKTALIVLVEVMVPVIIVFVKAVLAVFFQALAFLSVMAAEGRGIFSVSAAFSGILHIPETGWIFFFFLQGLMNDRAPGIFRID